MTFAATLNGVAKFEELNKAYYIGALELPSKATTLGQIQALPNPKLMRFTVIAPRWSTARFANQWNRQIILNNDNTLLNNNADDIFAFTELAKDHLVSGDTITIEATKNGETLVKLNEVLAIKTKNSDLFTILLNTWIGKKPPSTIFKQRILGQQAYDSQDFGLLSSTKFTNSRKATIVKWFAPKTVKPKPVPTRKLTPAKMPEKALVSKQPTKKATPKLNKTDSANNTNQSTATIKSNPNDNIVAKQRAANQSAPKQQEPKLGLIEGSEKIVVDNSTTKQKTALEDSKTETLPLPPPPINKQAATEPNPPVAANRPLNKPIDNNKEELKAFKISVIKSAYKKIVYPEKALVLKLEGKVLVDIKLNRSGELLSVKLARSSGHYVLDQTGIMAIREANFPKVPRSLDAPIKITVPFRFKL